MSAPATPVIKIKPSLVPFVWKGFVLVLLGLVFYAGILAFQLRSLFSSLPLDYAILGLIGLGFLGMLIGTVRRNAFTYLITNSDIVVQKQLFSRSVRRIPFSSISDVEVSQSLIGRLVGYGNIAPVTKSGYGLVRGSDPAENKVAEMTYVPKPDKVAELIISRASLTTRPPDRT
jgi:uncharacterized membrane protein YdbT with pleckstrin-like domain